MCSPLLSASIEWLATQLWNALHIYTPIPLNLQLRLKQCGGPCLLRIECLKLFTLASWLPIPNLQRSYTVFALVTCAYCISYPFVCPCAFTHVSSYNIESCCKPMADHGGISDSFQPHVSKIHGLQLPRFLALPGVWLWSFGNGAGATDCHLSRWERHFDFLDAWSLVVRICQNPFWSTISKTWGGRGCLMVTIPANGTVYVAATFSTY